MHIQDIFKQNFQNFYPNPQFSSHFLVEYKSCQLTVGVSGWAVGSWGRFSAFNHLPVWWVTSWGPVAVGGYSQVPNKAIYRGYINIPLLVGGGAHLAMEILSSNLPRD